MRIVAAVLALLTSSLCSVESEAQTNDTYQWVGTTSVAYAGDAGYVTMTAQCRADFGAGARMCTSQQVLASDSLNPNAIPTDGCWVHPILTATGSAGGDVSGLANSPFDLTCSGWSEASGWTGLVVSGDGGGFRRVACDIARPVACCKPQPVPSPSSSLSLPIGAGALAGLAMRRRGA